ncbi:MAG: 50S ribosomal protein L29 [Bacteroidaceae bacterium]|jgi:large subunit ribosomal protein L29|nr:50S ribosomal protein L29 [Bacteroidaceae bacterium]
MKSAEIKQIPTNELTERLATEVANYEQLLLNHSISPIADPSKIKSARRDIARIKTELRQRELNK